jgi:nucleoside phosphorylase
MACLPCDGYGTNNTAIVAANMYRTFPYLRIRLLVGIGGGIPTKGDIRLGDVVIGTKVIQYDLVKEVANGVENIATPRIPPSELRTVVSTLRSTHELRSSMIVSTLNQIRTLYPDRNKYTDPSPLYLFVYRSSGPKGPT